MCLQNSNVVSENHHRPLPYLSLFADIKPAIVDRFVTFHHHNPEVFNLFKRFAKEIAVAGVQTYGGKAIMERIRWHAQIECRWGDFKINNNFTSCYVRLLILEDPSYRAFFQTRRSPGVPAIQN